MQFNYYTPNKPIQVPLGFMKCHVINVTIS